jgi:hypothetical protein
MEPSATTYLRLKQGARAFSVHACERKMLSLPGIAVSRGIGDFRKFNATKSIVSKASPFSGIG